MSPSHRSTVLIENMTIGRNDRRAERFPGPIAELHVSTIHRREPICHKSYVSPVATAMIAGLSTHGYVATVRCV